ncbi:putative molybdopterin cofactor biosynthesis C (MoaC) domain, molybdenum cofactor biosynthesis C [Septoria linicola]|nr:putative molybdopterin cofactor biosynthesis C (MoaC) domain, molybdenum cofactor biosynthesis C [Septoria linicola]
MQVRNYSSDRGDSEEQSSSDSKGSTTPAARVASAFGFQSLSGLFETAGGRYSSPREAQSTGNTHLSATSQNGEGGADHSLHARREDNHTSETSAQERVDSALSDRSASSAATEAEPLDELPSRQAELQHAHTSAEIEAAFRNKFEAAGPAETTFSARRSPREGPSRPTPRRPRNRKSDLVTRPATATSIPWKRANPFAGTANLQTPQDQAFRRVTPPNLVTPVAERPWGLSTDDRVSVDSILEPGARSMEKEAPTSMREDARAANVNHATETLSQPLPVNSVTDDLKVVVSKKSHFRTGLTHLTSTGEAHMVDVGAKMESKRVAIATSYIRFSNPEPSRLISEDSNKKGDALGVARIAGIMAAKRTSDLIPLCHPIAINKVEVDMKTFGPWSRKAGAALWPPSNNHGVVVVQARVDCKGPTGVEMEALTAASTATLTIYDMCKAVDKGIVIGATQVVYKSGGKSGLYVEPRWAEQMGREWFEGRGLEVPAATAPSPEAARHKSLRRDADEKARSASTVEPTDHTVAQNITGNSPQSADEQRLVRAHYGKSNSPREGRRIALARRLRTLGR